MSVLTSVMKAINHQEVLPVPVVLWDLAPWMPTLFGVNVERYYRDFDVKLATQIQLQKTFPEAMFFPGLHPDYGVIVQPTAFGGQIQWIHDDAPYVHPCMDRIEGVSKIKPINPNTDGLMPVVLKEWELLWKKADKDIVEKYGYLRGHAVCMGPVETAGLMLGYDKLFNNFYDEPELVHKLLEILTEETVNWVRAQEKVNGKIDRLFLFDHLSTQISPSHYDEFFHPYIKAIFTEFKDASIRLWHNEGRSSHVYDRIIGLGCNVYNFGADSLQEAKKAIGDQICLMGNLDSVRLIKNGTTDQIIQQVLENVRIGYKDGGFLISGAGGLSHGTPVAHVKAIVDAASVLQRHEDIKNE